MISQDIYGFDSFIYSFYFVCFLALLRTRVARTPIFKHDEIGRTRIIRANDWWSEFWSKYKPQAYLNIANNNLYPKLDLAS